jgi:AraC-like DNA-binding protein
VFRTDESVLRASVKYEKGFENMESGGWHTFFGGPDGGPVQRVRVSRPVERRWLHGIQLLQLYEVHAMPAYEFPPKSRPHGTFAAIRTLDGHGRVDLDHGALDLTGDTFALVEFAQLVRYRCAGDSWHFWWVQFESAEPLPMPVNACLHVPAHPLDARDLNTVFDKVPRESMTQRRIAIATLLGLLYRWYARAAPTRPLDAREHLVEGVVARMRSTVSAREPVSELAAGFGLSERRLREVFHEVTGQSPKQYYTMLRMEAARDLLRVGGLNVTQTADRLGFSSPYHFSAAFRRHFGVPPSRAAELD